MRLLQVKKARVEVRLAEQISYLSPIQRLPDDAILIIMKIVCEVDELLYGRRFYDKTQSAIRDGKRAPWSIAAVSRRWRLLALSTRQLWARVDCDDGRSSMQNIKFDRLRTSLQVERSIDAPLLVRAKVSERLFYGFMTSPLTAHVHRIQELDVHMNRDAWEGISLPRPFNLASLQRLRISHCDFSHQGVFDAPSLKHLVLQNYKVRQGTQGIITAPSWKALTSLHLENCELQQPHNLLQVLRLACNQSVLKIVPSGFTSHSFDTTQEEVTVVELCQLKHFHLCFRGHRALRRALQFIKAPNLTFLQVSTVRTEDLLSVLVFVESATSASEGRGNGISTLSVLNPYLSSFGATLVPLLRKLPSLQRLRLDYLQDYLAFNIDSLLLELAARSLPPEISSDAQWSPNLEEFHFTFYNPTKLSSLTSLRAFCDSRRECSDAFRTVYIGGGKLDRALDRTQELGESDLSRWFAESQRSGLINYPAPKESWVDDAF